MAIAFPENPQDIIGSLVSVEFHMFNGITSEIILGGEPNNQPPIMVICELYKEKDHFEETTGIQIESDSSYKCKCIWFSTSTNTFEEVWISSRLLKIIESPKKTENHTITFANCVTLKTLTLESKKRKISFKDSNGSEDNYTITALLTFVPPIMQVIGTQKSESKEPLFSLKTGTIQRYISRRLIKCKFFNSNSNKFSEIVLPEESLFCIPNPNYKLINIFSTSIEEKLLVHGKNEDEEFLLKPNKVIFLNGIYYISGLDWLTNKNVIWKINNKISIIDCRDKKSFIFNSLPDSKIESKKLTSYIIDAEALESIVVDIGKNQYIRIKYKNYVDSISYRTLKDCSVVELGKINKKVHDSKTEKASYYLKAFCMSSNEVRYFKIQDDRILKLQVIDLN